MLNCLKLRHNVGNSSDQSGISHKQAVQKVDVPYTVRTCNRKRLYSLLNAKPAPLYHVAYQEVASSIEAIMTMYADVVIPCLQRVGLQPGLLFIAHPIDERYETLHFLVSRGDLRDCWELVVANLPAKGMGIIDRIVMTYIDDIRDGSPPVCHKLANIERGEQSQEMLAISLRIVVDSALRPLPSASSSL